MLFFTSSGPRKARISTISKSRARMRHLPPSSPRSWPARIRITAMANVNINLDDLETVLETALSGAGGRLVTFELLNAVRAANGNDEFRDPSHVPDHVPGRHRAEIASVVESFHQLND